MAIVTYAFGQAIFGKIFDCRYVGFRNTSLGFALSQRFWSMVYSYSFTCHLQLALNIRVFAFFRSILGIAEAGNWPGATKGNAEWFPSKEPRAICTKENYYQLSGDLFYRRD